MQTLPFPNKSLVTDINCQGNVFVPEYSSSRHMMMGPPPPPHSVEQA